MDYKCECCNRSYKLKFNRDKHTLCCNLLHVSKRETKTALDSVEATPTNSELFYIIQTLSLECSGLRNELNKIKNSQRNVNKRLITEWLDQTYADSTNIMWKDYKTVIDPKFLQCIFDSNLVNGIKMILEEEISKISIKSFTQKVNVLYVYGLEDNKWYILPEINFNNWMNHIKHKITGIFLKWREDLEKTDISKDKLEDIFVINFQKVLGRNSNKENNELYQWLYKRISQNITMTTVE